MRLLTWVSLCVFLTAAGCSLGTDLAGFSGGSDDVDAGSDTAGLDTRNDASDAPSDADDGPDAADDVPDRDLGADTGMPDAVEDTAEDTADAEECVPTGEDEPDSERVDADCDGLDGDISDAIFVSPGRGSDDNDGSPEAPVASLAMAIDLAQRWEVGAVYLEASEHSLSTAVSVPSGIDLHGGYVLADAEWTRPPAGELHQTLLRGPGPLLVYTDLNRPTRLSGLSIHADNAEPGASSIAVLVVDSESHLHIDDAQITAGTGGQGAMGLAGVAGESGSAGGAPNVAQPGAPGRSTACRGNSDGGRGGSGGVLGEFQDQLGKPGQEGDQDTPGGDGGGPMTPGSPGRDGRDGLHGGVGGQSLGNGRIVDKRWEPAPGKIGSAGSGGGGGGGGGGGAFTPSDNEDAGLDGGGGGGGGGGGCGGEPGNPGGGGGASIGLAVVQSTVTIRNTTVASSEGGAGGQGGAGGVGGRGGEGGDATNCPVCGHLGGDGGNGGLGGCGANGSGGVGGPSLAILLVRADGASDVELDTGVELVPDRGGARGEGGASGCDGQPPAPPAVQGWSLEIGCCTSGEGGHCDDLDVCQ